MNNLPLPLVRRSCLALPESSKRLTHGEPTFFVQKKVFIVSANNHHKNCHVAIWLPVSDGFESSLIEAAPDMDHSPPDVGVELGNLQHKDLILPIQTALQIVAPNPTLSKKGIA